MKHSEIATLLPEIYQRAVADGSPLYAVLEVMESLHRPSEEILENLETWFDPYQTPDRFVTFLAHWVDLDRFFPEMGDAGQASGAHPAPVSSGLGRLRELIFAAAFLSQWRGTSLGLKRFLETATGVRGFELDEQVKGADGVVRPYHLCVRVPHAAEPYIGLVRRIVEQEKPAYVTHDIEFMQVDSGES